MTRCAQIQRMIWSSTDDSVVERHAAECVDCGLELRRAQLLGRQLSGLSTLPARVDVPDNLYVSLVESAIGASVLEKIRTSKAFWGTVSVGAAAAAATVGVLIARRRVTRQAAAA